MYRGRENRKTAQYLSEHGAACIIVVYGHSLAPVTDRAGAVVAKPLTADKTVKVGDLVFCRLHGHYRIQKVRYIKENEHYAVGNTRGYVHGTIGREDIYGRVVKVFRNKTRE